MKIWIALLFSGLILDSASAGDGGQQPATSWIGNDSGISAPLQTVVRNSEDWKKLWSQIHSNREPMPPIPEIDFSTHMVVGYFMGQQSTGGYSVSIENIEENDKIIIVNVTTKSPGRNSIVSQALTSPYAIQVIPSSKNPVDFKLNSQ